MNAKERETMLKLELLESLVRSQKALTFMLEQVTETSDFRSAAVADIGRNLKVLLRCQQALAVQISGIRIPQVRRGRPGEVWLQDGVAAITK